IWERKILSTAGRSAFTALASADSLDELRQKHAALRHLRTVSEVDSALLLIPDDQPAKLKIIRDFAPIVAPIRVGRATPVDIERLIDALETLRRRFELAANEVQEGETKLCLAKLTEVYDLLLCRLRQIYGEM